MRAITAKMFYEMEKDHDMVLVTIVDGKGPLLVALAVRCWWGPMGGLWVPLVVVLWKCNPR